MSCLSSPAEELTVSLEPLGVAAGSLSVGSGNLAASTKLPASNRLPPKKSIHLESLQTKWAVLSLEKQYQSF